MNERPPEPQDDDLAALAEGYVMGTLSAPRRRAVQARLVDEPAMQAAVEALEARLLPLARLAEPVQPSPGLWPRIAASIRDPAVPAARPVAAPAGWWNSLGFWRAGAAAGFAAAAFMAFVLVQRETAPPPGTYLVVLVAPQDRTPGWVVQARGRPGSETIELVPLGQASVPAGKSLQFWTKADAWSGPRSLGLVQPGQPLRIDRTDLPPLEANQLFELTLEPAQGSPIDRPTGPIQFIGRAVRTRL